MGELHRDEVFVRRLESFSDIVIAFSLAQLGLSLAIPAHPQHLLADPGWIVAYVFTFALVCLMWWSHYRLFRTVFVPDALDVVLNYAWLATVGLLVFLMQVFVHSSTSDDAALAARLYFGLLALNFGINALLLVLGLRKPQVALDEAGRSRVYAVAWGMGASTVLMVAAIIVGIPYGVNAIPFESGAIFIGFGAGTMLGRRLALRAT